MSEANTDLGYMDRHVDIKRIEYYGHSNPDCELDLKKSAFLEPTEKDFNYHQEQNLAERAIWQEKYNHERSLDCLAVLNFKLKKPSNKLFFKIKFEVNNIIAHLLLQKCHQKLQVL